jgi:hypothetical protein
VGVSSPRTFIESMLLISFKWDKQFPNQICRDTQWFGDLIPAALLYKAYDWETI